jgi:hypothetical protein
LFDGYLMLLSGTGIFFILAGKSFEKKKARMALHPLSTAIQPFNHQTIL